MSDTDTEDRFLTIRLPDDLLDRLRELAKLNERAAGAEARLAIREHVERHLHSRKAPA